MELCRSPCGHLEIAHAGLAEYTGVYCGDVVFGFAVWILIALVTIQQRRAECYKYSLVRSDPNVRDIGHLSSLVTPTRIRNTEVRLKQ